MSRLSLIARLVIHPAYAIGQRLHLAGINPTAAALATVAAILAVAVNINDRHLVSQCESNGENSTVCTLKIIGR
jgi:hypothetical protein